MKEIEHEQPSSKELNLIDLWRILRRRKMTMLLTFAAILLVAIAYNLLAKPLYQSTVVVQVGQILEKGQFIEGVDGIRQRLLAEHPELHTVTVEKGKNGAINIFTLSTQNSERTQAEEQLLRIVNKLLTDHKSTYDQVLSLNQQKIALLETQARDYRMMIDKLNHNIESLKKDDPVQVVMLLIERIRIFETLNQIENQIIMQQRSLMEPYSMATRQLGPPDTPEKPVHPRVMVITALSLFLGIILSIFTAVFFDFLDRVIKKGFEA